MSRSGLDPPCQDSLGSTRSTATWKKLLEATGFTDEKLTQIILSVGCQYFKAFSDGNSLAIIRPDQTIVETLRNPKGKMVAPFNFDPPDS